MSVKGVSVDSEPGKSTDEPDVNQVFDNLLLAEEIAERSGYKEGFKIGSNRQFEGYHLGYHRASVLAAQLGYYSGTLLLFQNHLSAKVAEAAQKLSKEIDNFPRTNDENVDLQAAFDLIKLKFHKFCTLAKISPVYPEADKLEF